MKQVLFAIALSLACAHSMFSQGPKNSPAAAPVKYDAEIALAKKALEAHGGEKLKTMKSLIVRGSVDITLSSVNQAIPASFYVVLAKEKFRFEIMNQFQPFKQVFDGVNLSSTGGVTLPPIGRLGFPMLTMIGEPGFIITPLPDAKKKKVGFRITSPDGYSTNFYLDEKTNLVKGYDASYDINGRIVSTSVEISTTRVVDGITVPEKYAQRFDAEQGTFYADFKTKEIVVNMPVDDDVFSVGK